MKVMKAVLKSFYPTIKKDPGQIIGRDSDFKNTKRNFVAVVLIAQWGVLFYKLQTGNFIGKT
jgi:hypothetical protein